MTWSLLVLTATQRGFKMRPARTWDVQEDKDIIEVPGSRFSPANFNVALPRLFGH